MYPDPLRQKSPEASCSYHVNPLQTSQPTQPAGHRRGASVEHDSAELAFLNLLNGAVDHRYWRGPGANDADHAIGEIGQEDGVAIGQNRWQIENDYVVRLAHRVHNYRHMTRAEGSARYVSAQSARGYDVQIREKRRPAGHLQRLTIDQ